MRVHLGRGTGRLLGGGLTLFDLDPHPSQRGSHVLDRAQADHVLVPLPVEPVGLPPPDVRLAPDDRTHEQVEALDLDALDAGRDLLELFPGEV